MRKIYLLITAALLLICSSAHALLIATVGDKAFDSDSYSTYGYPNAVAFYFALMESGKQNLPAVIQNDFTLEICYTTPKSTIDLNGHSISSATRIFQIKKVSVDIIGEGTLNSSNGTAIELYGSAENIANYNSLYIGENVTLNAPNGWGISIFGDDNSMNNAYGVVVNIDGRINASSGITISGNVNKTEGNVPIININDGAKIYGQVGGNGYPEPDGQDGNSIYAAGYGIWNVGKATLTANSPIHAKAGIINLSGTTITATRDYYTQIRYYANGGKPTGNAIAIESNHKYAGNVFLNISNGTTITSKAGYAIEEAIVCNGDVCKDETQQIGLTVQNGAGAEGVNAFSGAKGTMAFSESFAQALRDGSINGKAAGDYTWVVNGIVSGKYTAMPEVVADGYEVVVTSDAQFPYTVQRITEPIIPQESTEYITENTTSATVRTVGTTVDDKFAVIVKSGVTYEIEGLVVGNNAETEAKLVVEPGATLIVGASGIITHKAGNLILRADKEHGTAKLIFRDANSANTNPLATVELYLRARTIDAEAKTQLWQHYGLPVSYDEGLTSVEKNFGVNYNNWIVGQGWKYVTGDDMLSQGAWAGHNITTNTSVEGSIIRFKGQLIGRDNKELDFVPGYSCFTNSYTAPLSLRSLRDKLNASGVADPTIWIYDVSYAPTFRFVNNSFKDAEFLDKGIATMQAYFIPSEANGHSLTIDYDNDVIGFSNGSVKDAEVSEYNGGTIVLSDGFNESEVIITEGDDFSDAFDRGWDANLMEGLIPAIYVADGSAKYASFATNAIEGKKINIVTNNATEYSLSFKYLKGKAFKLKDLASGAEVEVSAENVYRFTAAANSTIERFELMEGSVAANEADADAVKIWVANKALNVAGAAEGDAIEIINLAGVKILSAVATGEAVQTISLNGIASGAYIVKAGAATVKVIK